MKFLYTTLLITLSVVSNEATACDKSRLSGETAFEFATSIFRGKVENLQYLDPPEKNIPEPRIIVTFKVDEVFKGELEDQVVIHTTHNKGSCNGYVFTAGQEYLVYTKENKKIKGLLAFFIGDQPTKTGVKVFAGTKPLTNAASDIAYLETLK